MRLAGRAILTWNPLSDTILLALDFAIGADIIKVAANPELSTVFVVGGVVAIRIALTLVIVWELRREPPVQAARDVAASTEGTVGGG